MKQLILELRMLIAVYLQSGGIGIGIGTVMAVILSWTTWHSIGWAIVNGIFGWLYVIYWWINYG